MSSMKRTLITLSIAACGLATAPAALAASHLSQGWKLHKVSAQGSVVVDAGTVKGTPYGPGSIRVKTTAHSDGTIALSFRERLAHGTLTGQARLTYRFNAAGDKVLYRGSGRLTGGTGRYSHDKGRFRLKGTGLPNGHATMTISAA
jgi:hypothetical protein